ncbi:MAG: hypothetical protein L6R42_002848 [Xanthoria sp. 1 TBL-2021]|nr:MAG: hypothetical protein L6R42_002848 [Xanthoria sp. 1 TBL-2021]
MRSYSLATALLALPFITTPSFTHATSELHQRDSDMTIAVTNHYGAPLQLSFGVNAGVPGFRGDPQPTTLDKDATSTYAVPSGWAGRINVGKVDHGDNSKIEGSFYGAGKGDIDVSYVDGYSVPITCSAGGKVLSGCNIELMDRGCNAPDHVSAWGSDGKPALCSNGMRGSNWGPPSSFFAPCAGAAYTFPKDDMANVGMISETQISCCIGTSCDPSPRQHKRDLSSTKANAPSLMPRQHKLHRQIHGQ